MRGVHRNVALVTNYRTHCSSRIRNAASICAERASAERG